MYAYDFVNLRRRGDRCKPGSTEPAQGHRGAEQVTVQGANGDSARLQPAQPRGRRRRRRLFRAVPRHDVRARPGRRALEDPAADPPDSMSASRPVWRLRVLALAAPAAASRRSRASPRSPRRSPRSRRRRRSAAARRRPREGVRHHVDATTRVRSRSTRRDAVRRHRHQRLDVSQPGDYYFTIGAPVTDVAPAYGSQSTPGLRAATILWAGFNPGKRVLAARATLDPAAVAARCRFASRSHGGRVRLANATGDHDDRIRRRRAQAATRDVPRRRSGAQRGGQSSDRRWRTRDVAARADDGAGDRAAARDRDDRRRRHVDVGGSARPSGQLPGRRGCGSSVSVLHPVPEPAAGARGRAAARHRASGPRSSPRARGSTTRSSATPTRAGSSATTYVYVSDDPARRRS